MRRILTIAVVVLSSSAAGAQVVRGRVVLPDSVTPAAGVIIVATDANGAIVKRALAGSGGDFIIGLPGREPYTLTMMRIGFRPVRGPTISGLVDDLRTVRLVFDAQPVILSAVNVHDRETCRVNADTGFMVARVWDEARKAMLSTQLSAENAPLFAEWIEYDRMLDSAARLVREQRVRTSRNPTTHAFRSQPAELLASNGYVVSENGATTFYAPDAEVLLSDRFAADHCFRLETAPGDRADLIGVGFSPGRDRRDMREIEGTLWLDRASSELRTLDFRYTNLPDVTIGANAGGSVDFLRLADGNWLVNRWSVRMPQLATRPRISDNGLRRTVMAATRAVLRGVQVTGGEVMRVTRHDSLVYQLAGAYVAVQAVSRDRLLSPANAKLTLDGTDYSAVADSSGRIRLAPVLAGNYRARVTTPLMESLGMPPVTLDLAATTAAHVDSVSLPSSKDVLTKACPRDSISHGEGMLHGSVRDESGRGVSHAAVEVTGSRSRAIRGYSDDTGWWRVCGVPRRAEVSVRAVADSAIATATTQLADDFAALDLVVRRPAVVAIAEPARTADPSRALVEFSVITSMGTPVPDVTLEIKTPGVAVRSLATGADGKATAELPPGRLEVRARRIGFRQGDVAASVDRGRNTIPLILSEVAAPTLDTVRVLGNREVLARHDEFETRRLLRLSTISITREEILRRNPPSTWQMLMNIPSIRIVDSDTMVAAVSTRTVVANMSNTPCFMVVMVNGLLKRPLPGQRGSDLRDLPATDEIYGIEVFAGAASIPVQYGGSGDGKWCGMIAIWTR